MYVELFNAIIYAEEFKKLLLNQGLDDLEIAAGYIAYLYPNIPIIGKNLCAGFVRAGLNTIFNVTNDGEVIFPKYKLFKIPRGDGICVGCNNSRIVIRVSEEGYDPDDLLESISLYSRVFIRRGFKLKSMENIKEKLDVESIRNKAKKEILSLMISAGGTLHPF